MFKTLAFVANCVIYYNVILFFYNNMQISENKRRPRVYLEMTWGDTKLYLNSKSKGKLQK